MTRHSEIEAVALDWLIRKCDADWSAHDAELLDDWLAQSYAHKAAFWRAEFGWQQAQRIGSLGPWTEQRPSIFRRMRWLAPSLVAASILLAVGLGSISIRNPVEPLEQFSAPLGGRATVSLPDGSRVELNTNTRIRASRTFKQRQIWLDDGEAFFDIAHRQGEPFTVHIGQQTVTVVGTKFSVRKDRGKVTVKVLEGRVNVDVDSDGGAHSSTIGAGQFTITTDGSTLQGRIPDDELRDAFLWRSGMLSFDSATLEEVVAEFNRYHRKPIVIADPALRAIELGGTFRAENEEAFVRLLRDAYSLDVDENETEIIISR